MNRNSFFNFKSFKVQALAAVAVLCGRLIAARGSVDAARVHLKLADANEGPARITMAPAAKTAMPAVVKISASKVVKAPTAFSGPGGDDADQFFGQFFGRQGGIRLHVRIAKGGSTPELSSAPMVTS